MVEEFANNDSRTLSWDNVPEKYLRYLSLQDRAILFPIFLVLYIIALVANLCAIRSTITRKHRCIQKTLIISLSLTDLITATAYSFNYLEQFSHPLINWTLGKFLCSFIPLLQIFGVTASSIVLVAIAADRYRNVVHVMAKKWNPSRSRCLCGVSLVWSFSAGVAYPMYNYFVTERVMVAFVDHESGRTYYEEKHLCVSITKHDMQIYYISITSIIFVPLIVIFLALYYKVAQLIWKHRKPVVYRQRASDNDKSNGNETSITQTKSNEEPETATPTVAADVRANRVPAKRSVHVERKIRTFKIILCLMLVFIGCRLPYFVFNVNKLSGTYKAHANWIMVYVFNGLALLNCTLNPLLYTFLHPTIDVLMRVRKSFNDFTCQVCCCWCSNAEFDDFGRDNPFGVEEMQRERRAKF